LEDAGASVAVAVCECALEFLASVGAANVRRAAAAPKKIACPNRMGISPFRKRDVCENQRQIVEIFWNPSEVCRHLLNVRQTPRMPVFHSAGRILFSRNGTSVFGCALARHHAEGTASMRHQKSLLNAKSLFNALLTHFLMGVALGLSLVLLLGLIDAFHVRDLVAKSDAPVQTVLMLVTTYGLMFGIGATLTGLVLTLEDES
jgi:hypothetical protein